MRTDSRQCAICGQQLRDIDKPEHTSLVVAFPGIAELFSNSDAVDITNRTRSLLLCNEHWDALIEQASKPGKLSLQSIDGEYVGQDRLLEEKRMPSDKPSWRETWDQHRIRWARQVVYFDTEVDNIRVEERVEAALLVAAVDGYRIEYGSVEVLKDSLITALQEHDVSASRLRHPNFDVKIEFDNSEREIVGIVSRIADDDGIFRSGMLSEYEATPERRVTNTRDLRIGQETLNRSAISDNEVTHCIGFYWLEGQERWV